MDLTLVKEIEKAKGGTIRVDFWIKSRKYTKRLSIDTIDSVICALNDDSTPFIIVCDNIEAVAINKRDIVDITINNRDYLYLKNEENNASKNKEQKEWNMN